MYAFKIGYIVRAAIFSC